MTAPATTTRPVEQPLAVLWRQKWWLLAWVVLFTGGVYAVVSQQTPKFTSTATIAVGQGQTARQTVSFDTVQANQAYARTLAKLIGKPSVAEAVVRRLPFQITPDAARKEMTFDPLQETQLLEVTAVDPDPARAQVLANTWASTFVTYAMTDLRAVAPSDIALADAAATGKQSEPRPKLAAIVALLVAATVGAAFALLRARFDRRIRDVGRLSDFFGVPVLATLPRRGKDKEVSEAFSEAVRVLRTNLQFLDLALRSVSITSTRQGEGKSTVASELLRSFALLSLVEGTVLGVDADLRRPALLERLDIPRPSRGLTDYLLGGVELEDVVVASELPALRLLGPGKPPVNPSTMLGYVSSREAMLRLAQAAPVVVWDTPPLVAGADAALVAASVDGVIVVVDLGMTSTDELQETLDSLRRVSANVLGFVVNRDSSGVRRGGYYYEESKRRRARVSREQPLMGAGALGDAERPLPVLPSTPDAEPGRHGADLEAASAPADDRADDRADGAPVVGGRPTGDAGQD